MKNTERQANRLIAEPVDTVPGRSRWWDIARDEKGQDLAEYAILIGLIVLVVIGAVTLLGTQLVAAYNAIAGQIGAVSGGS